MHSFFNLIFIQFKVKAKDFICGCLSPLAHLATRDVGLENNPQM